MNKDFNPIDNWIKEYKHQLTDSVLKNDTTDVNKYLLKLQDINPKLPENIFLMSGDGNLAGSGGKVRCKYL